MTAHNDEFLPEPDDGELVHWMEPKHLEMGLGGVSAATLGAFALGALAMLALLALRRRL